MDELGRMFGIYDAGPRLPWLWIIEYLSSFPHIDTSIIRGLIKAAPVLPDDLGKNTSEMVALRCLEELYGPKSSVQNVVPPDTRVSFDLSLSCEDVLEQILQEVPLSNLKNAGPELLKWDVYPFIKHKRTSLPKCALDKLKDSILEKIPVIDGNKDIPTSRFDDNDDEIGNCEGNLFPQNHGNNNETLQDGLLDRALLHFKRCRDDLVAGDLVGLVSINQDGINNNCHTNAKKSKPDATPTCAFQADEQISIRLHGQGREATEIEGINLGKDSQVGEGVQHGHVASRTIGPRDAVVHPELLDNQMENVQNAAADMMVAQKYGERLCQNVLMDETNYFENCVQQKGPSGDAGETIDQRFLLTSLNSTSTNGLQKNTDVTEAKGDTDHPCVEEICLYEDGRFNIAMMKSLFLSSQCTQSQDPVLKAGWRRQNLCVKCNHNGQLLVCSSRGCPLVVHERCLDSAARFDDEGNFYCPLCAYSVSISKYLESKEKSSLARKELAAFMELCSKNVTVELKTLQSQHLGRREGSFMGQDQDVNHGPPASCLNENKLGGEEKTFMCGAVGVAVENNEEETVIDGYHSTREHEDHREELPANLTFKDDNPNSGKTELVPANQVEDEVHDVNAEALEPQIIDTPQLPLNSDSEESSTDPSKISVNGDGEESSSRALQVSVNSGGEESSTDASDKFIISNYCIRFRKRDTKHSFSPIPQLRRKTVPWMKDEEEMLRKGVEKFANNGGSIPWKSILEFGAKVFLKGRSTVDLKDKWRNMCKGSPSCK